MDRWISEWMEGGMDKWMDEDGGKKQKKTPGVKCLVPLLEALGPSL